MRTCGAIQNESRPISTCQRMSQPSPQPAVSLLANKMHSAARRRAMTSTSVAMPERARAPGRLMGRILPATGPGQQVVERARVEDLVAAEPGAPGDGDAEIDVVQLGEVVRVGADRERHARLRRAPRVDVVEIEPLGRGV